MRGEKKKEKGKCLPSLIKENRPSKKKKSPPVLRGEKGGVGEEENVQRMQHWKPLQGQQTRKKRRYMRPWPTGKKRFGPAV